MMRQGSNSGRRARGRTNRKQHGGGGQSRTHTFDSNGPDGRVRGNARQVYEKYLTLARDASSAGDRVAAEAYYQHAEHYFRILSDSTDPQPSGRRQEERQPQVNGDDPAGYDAAQSSAEANDHGGQNSEDGGGSRRNGVSQAESGAQDAQAAESEPEAPQRPRRGRPRKPRSEGDGQPAAKEAAETEEGQTAG